MRKKGFRAEKAFGDGPINQSMQASRQRENQRRGEKAAWRRDDSPSLATSGACGLRDMPRWRPRLLI